MSNIVGNLPPPTSIDNTNEYFDNLIGIPYSISPSVNDALVGFFQDFTGSKESGKILAGTVLYTAAVTGTDPMSIIDELRKIKTGIKTEIKTPVSPGRFNSNYNSYQAVELDKLEFVPGQLFYIPPLNIFYELDIEYNLIATAKYKAESVSNSQLEDTVIYNYYEVSYQFTENELNTYLTMFLNLNRVGTSLLGINNTPPVSKYVSRTILA